MLLLLLAGPGMERCLSGLSLSGTPSLLLLLLGGHQPRTGLSLDLSGLLLLCDVLSLEWSLLWLLLTGRSLDRSMFLELFLSSPLFLPVSDRSLDSSLFLLPFSLDLSLLLLALLARSLDLSLFLLPLSTRSLDLSLFLCTLSFRSIDRSLLLLPLSAWSLDLSLLLAAWSLDRSLLLLPRSTRSLDRSLFFLATGRSLDRSRLLLLLRGESLLKHKSCPINKPIYTARPEIALYGDVISIVQFLDDASSLPGTRFRMPCF